MAMQNLNNKTVEATIAVLEGDGIGPEIMREGIKVLDEIAKTYYHDFKFVKYPYGAQAFYDFGSCFPEKTIEGCKNADTILKGPVGLDTAGTDDLKSKGVKLEKEAIIGLRQMLDSYACYRPVILPKEFVDFSPLKSEIIGEGIDILMVRELTGGIYTGTSYEGFEHGKKMVSVQASITHRQIERLANVAFLEARKKASKLTCVHKRNIIPLDELWYQTFVEIGRVKFPDVKLEDCLVDSLATNLVKKPTYYNGVMVLENLQGDIITDLAGGIIGSLGFMPSACWNHETKKGYFEPSHGSAPDIAGKNIANPYSMIGSVAMMLDIKFGLQIEANAVWSAMKRIYTDGYRTHDVVNKSTPKNMILSTRDFGDKVVEYINS